MPRRRLSPTHSEQVPRCASRYGLRPARLAQRLQHNSKEVPEPAQPLHLSTADPTKVGFHPWLNIQSARWLKFGSAPTIDAPAPLSIPSARTACRHRPDCCCPRRRGGASQAEQQHGVELVNTFKRDYVSHMEPNDSAMVLAQLLAASERFNDVHPYRRCKW